MTDGAGCEMNDWMFTIKKNLTEVCVCEYTRHEAELFKHACECKHF